MKRLTHGLLCGLLAWICLAAPASAQVTVFAAASLKTALDDVSAAFEEETGTAVSLSYAGTSALARQIDAGAPADVVLSANVDWMDWLEDRDRLAPGTRRDLLRNGLVLIAPADSGAPATVSIDASLTLGPLLDGGRLAMAFVDAVPAGIYGRAALTSLGLWEAAEPQVAQFDNVRSALAAVSVGAAPLGIVYRTDAAADPRVRVLGSFPADSHAPIIYPVAGLGSEMSAEARAFLDFLFSGRAGDLFEAQGFALTGD